MSRILSVLAVCLLLAALPGLAQQGDKGKKIPYEIQFDPDQDLVQHDKDEHGRAGVFLTVRFGIKRVGKGPDEPGVVYKVILEEEGVKRFEFDVPKAQVVATDDLVVMLAMDTSGSMMEFRRMEQTRTAATIFVKALPAKAECGLALFNHEVYKKLKPSRERDELQRLIANAQPSGGTAYLDATDKCVELVKDFVGKQKAVVLITDGVDINSRIDQEEVIKRAVAANVKVYTIGIGKPGKQEPVTSVLVLDRSGSMKLPAKDGEKLTKIDALKGAAVRFVNSVSQSKRCAILDFGDAPNAASEFTNDKKKLQDLIHKLKAEGETCLFDAIYDGIATLEAEEPLRQAEETQKNPKQKVIKARQVVVALTDGIDNKSRRRAEEVIQRAKEANIPLYILGFGQAGVPGKADELDIAAMTRMAKETGGEFYHADNEAKLIQLFEDLATKIHDDGIDEIALKRLALATGGKYYAAEDVKQLQFILEKVTQEIKSESITITKTFGSVRQVRDGLPRRVGIYLVKRVGEKEEKLGGGKTAVTLTRSIVIAQMDHLIYLFFLAILGTLIALPAMLRRKSAS